MNRLRKAGLEFVGMSSVGPSIAIITSMKEKELRQDTGSDGALYCDHYLYR